MFYFFYTKILFDDFYKCKVTLKYPIFYIKTLDAG